MNFTHKNKTETVVVSSLELKLVLRICKARRVQDLNYLE